MAANGTILILEGLPMANLKAYVPNFPKHPLRKSKIFKIEGVMPLQSQVIPICVTQKSCFFGIF